MEYFYTFAEHWRTFFYDWGYLVDTGGRIGGIATLLSDFLLQFSVTPFAGMIVMLLELGLVVFLLDRFCSKLSGNHWLMPMAFLAASSLVILHANPYYSFSGTVALILTLLAVNVQRGIAADVTRFWFTIVSSVVLLVAAGPTAALYVVVIFLSEFFTSPRGSLRYLLPVLVVALCAQCCVWFGWTPGIKKTLLPFGYFNPMFKGGSILMLPWTLVLADVALAGLWGALKLRKGWLCGMLLGLQVLGCAWFCILRIPGYLEPGNRMLMKLSYKVYHQDWYGVLDTCSGTPMTNLVHQNYLNLALAETGHLGDYLFKYPSYDIQSLYLKDTKDPWLYPVLSDVYFSMGHMALSQKHAFEALQTVGNYSPRLLQRLVQTNETLGYTEVAQKYRRLLSKTLFYRKWALEYTLPEDVAACVIPRNTFCAEEGLDSDLAQIVKANPAHGQTVQYLGALSLLLRDIDHFRNFIETFYGTEALPAVLPVAFQEGVSLFARGDEETLKHYNIDQKVISRFDDYLASHSSERNSFWYFLFDKL